MVRFCCPWNYFRIPVNQSCFPSALDKLKETALRRMVPAVTSLANWLQGAIFQNKKWRNRKLVQSQLTFFLFYHKRFHTFSNFDPNKTDDTSVSRRNQPNWSTGAWRYFFFYTCIPFTIRLVSSWNWSIVSIVQDTKFRIPCMNKRLCSIESEVSCHFELIFDCHSLFCSVKYFSVWCLQSIVMLCSYHY